MRLLSKRFVILGLSGVLLNAVHGTAAPLELGNNLFRYSIATNAQNVAFVDLRSGRDWLDKSAPTPCAIARISGRTQAATAAALKNGRLELRFGDGGPEAVLSVQVHPSWVMLKVESVSSEVGSLTFLNVPLTLNGTPDEVFGACALSLNLMTRVDALPALQKELRATCEKKFGLVGARVAIVAAPMERMLPALQEALTEGSELPVCRTAGPWARASAFNRGSYLFNFGSLTETNVADWVDMVRTVGFSQIDNHGGSAFFKFGSMELNRAKWAGGWDSWQRIVARLHEAGIGSIFHTYAFFLDKQSKYVTPVPDPRLDAFRTFTLAQPLTADATEIPVVEPTDQLSTVTGFFVQNSVTLEIEGELVTFAGASRSPPWRFTGVTRGALGTRAKAHARGAAARHLKETLGLFVPNPESSLFEEIAANHAEVVDHCGFDGIYLDAIDCSSILRGSEDSWYWASKFVVEIQKRLKKPVGMEMSAMHHHFWQYRTRWQAWDYPQRGQKRFIDLHAQAVNGGLLLPLHLGWWSFQAYNPPQIEPTYPDVMEYLGAKLIGWDAGISLTAGVDRKTLDATPLFRRAVETLRTCEDLRRTNAFDEAAKARLREYGKEFELVKARQGGLRFRPLRTHSQTVATLELWTLSWQVTNVFSAQPLRLRLEALSSAVPGPETNASPETDFAKIDPATWRASSAQGVSFAVNPPGAEAGPGLTIVATNAGTVVRNSAWARLQRKFEPLVNLKERQALLVDVEGDGSGAVAAFRLESPEARCFGAVADRYLPLDFTGRRQVTLVETESARWSDYGWGDGKSAYNVYRETIDFGAIESASLYLQNLPPGRETRCRIVSARAVGGTPGWVKNPKITVDGNTVEFPLELASGSWLECAGPEDCQLYSAKGELLGKVASRGAWPDLRTGANAIRFSCESEGAVPARARVVVFSHGEAF